MSETNPTLSEIRDAVAALLLACVVAVGANAATVPIAPSLTVSGAAEHVIDGVAYVEARVGDAYTLTLRNPYPRRIGVLLSVDGLNTIDATEADGRLWILGPGETATIPGWQVSGATARKFVYAEERDSYARLLGRTTQTGVIRAVFVEEQRFASLTIPGSYTGSITLPVQGSTMWPEGTANSTLLAAPATAAGSMTLTSSAASLGTAMGNRTDHHVDEVAFTRGADIGTVEIHYVTPARLAQIRQATRYCPEVVGRR